MPNTGQPSRDCHNCRQRRIKCDLRRPACSQCVRKGMTCGYRDGQDARFRHESTSSLVLKMEKRSGSGSRVASPTVLRGRQDGQVGAIYVLNVPAKPRAGAMINSDSRPQSPLPASWNDHCMPLVMNKLSSDYDNGNPQTIFSGIPRFASKAERGSTLHQICDAIGRVYISNTACSSTARSDEARAYGKAIKAINMDLRDPRHCTSDATLISVFLLSLYELLSVPNLSLVAESSGWGIHTKGMIALLLQRGGKYLEKPEGRMLFLAIFNTIENQALATGQDYSEETLAWIHQLYEHCEPAEYNVVRTAIFAYHCSRLSILTQSLINADDSEKLLSAYPTILHDMENIETETSPLSHDEIIQGYVVDHPLTQKPLPTSHRLVGLIVYQSSFRLQVSLKVHAFLHAASQATGCTPQQRIMFLKAQKRCSEDFQALASRVLVAVDSSHGFHIFIPPDKGRSEPLYRLGLWDAVRLVWPLRLIASSSLSSDWGRKTAKEMLNMMHLRVRFV